MNLLNSVTSVYCFMSLHLSLLTLVSTFLVCFLMFLVSFFFPKVLCSQHDTGVHHPQLMLSPFLVHVYSAHRGHLC